MRSLLPLLCLASCTFIPRDPDGTLDRVRREHRFLVGEVNGGTADVTRRVVARVASEADARPVVRRGGLEPLLLELEAGDLDLVVGAQLDSQTPWRPRVTIGQPFEAMTYRERTTAEHVVTRNGENAWIMLVQRAVKTETSR